jgi:GTP-binding protein
MRREGYEFQVSRPRVITHERGDGLLAEPYEELVVDVPEAMLGVMIEKMGVRRGDMIDMRNPGQGRVRMSFRVPSRGLFGFRSEFLTDTQGEGTLHHRFLEYGPWCGSLGGRSRGVLVADREGEAVAYGLYGLQDRSTLFVKPGEAVYEGMIVGENSRSGDMDVNVCKEKKLTNIRAAASDENVLLEAPRRITLELALEYIEEDELIEITPDAIRLRKRALTASARKKAARSVRDTGVVKVPLK